MPDFPGGTRGEIELKPDGQVRAQHPGRPWFHWYITRIAITDANTMPGANGPDLARSAPMRLTRARPH